MSLLTPIGPTEQHAMVLPLVKSQVGADGDRAPIYLAALKERSPAEWAPWRPTELVPNPKDMTFDIQKYCAARFTDTVLSAVIEKRFPVRVYGGSAQAALTDLANDGYTLATPFPARRGKFTRLLATKSDRDPPLVVFIALNGDSMVTKISNALRLYRNEEGQTLRDDQIQIRRQVQDLYGHFSKILRGLRQQPMGVVFGQRDALKKVIEIRAPNRNQPVEIADTELHATEITVGHGQHQRSLLLCTISPYLYGERAGVFARAALEIGIRNFNFLGTAGGLDAATTPGMIVVPHSIHLRQNGQVTPLAVPNHMFLGEGSVRTSGHITVPTVLVEDVSSVEHMRSLGAQTVDCELGYIARAVHDVPDARLSYGFRVTDNPGTDKDIGKPYNYSNANNKRFLSRLARPLLDKFLTG